MFEENSGREGRGAGRGGGAGGRGEGKGGREGNHVIAVTSSFSKCFLSTLKRKAGGFEERFRKAPFP